MDKLKKNDARFCAKYIKFVGVGFIKRNLRGENLKINGEEFAFGCHNSRDLEVGDMVYLAKRIPTFKSQPERWEVHLITLAEDYWHYEYWEKKTPKEKRIYARKPYPVTWFGNNRFIVKKVK